MSDSVTEGRDVGIAFAFVCDRGFAVGLCTHRHPRLGHLVWVAAPFFDHFPSIDDANGISQWRWPIFYPLGAALRRRIVDRIGRATIPSDLVAFPTVRAGGQGQPWMEYRDGNLDGLGPTTIDRNLPISMIVNHEMLKEMLVTDWRPADRW